MTAGSYPSPALSGNAAQGWFLVAMVRMRSAPTSARPGMSAVSENLAPRIDGIAGKQRRDVAAAVDGGDVEGVGEAVEGQRAGERDDMPAIDEPPAEAAVLGGVLVEVDFCRVLVEARRDLVLGLLDRHAVDMVDALARRIVAKAVRAAGELEIVGGGVERRAGRAEVFGIDAPWAAPAHDRRARARRRRAF